MLQQLKDETGVKPIEEFIGMRAKLYPIKIELEEKDKDGNTTIIRQKAATAGTMSHIAKKYLNHQASIIIEVFLMEWRMLSSILILLDLKIVNLHERLRETILKVAEQSFLRRNNG